MNDLIERAYLIGKFEDTGIPAVSEMGKGYDLGIAAALRVVKSAPSAEAEPVKHGRWVECDYKHLEHGFMETEPNAGRCCSECRAAFQKKKMTYKQYCAACGAKMDGGADNG